MRRDLSHQPVLSPAGLSAGLRAGACHRVRDPGPYPGQSHEQAVQVEIRPSGKAGPAWRINPSR